MFPEVIESINNQTSVVVPHFDLTMPTLANQTLELVERDYLFDPASSDISRRTHIESTGRD
jgi:hypothetical protein